MNSDIFEGKWKQFKGDLKKEWGKLTDDDFDRIEGNRDKLEGALQERYGYSREEAHRRLDDFVNARSAQRR